MEEPFLHGADSGDLWRHSMPMHEELMESIKVRLRSVVNWQLFSLIILRAVSTAAFRRRLPPAQTT